MTYLPPAERMKISLRRSEAEATGKPLYKGFDEVPSGYMTKTMCAKAKEHVKVDEEPAAYVLCRAWNGYLPLYYRAKVKT